MQKNLLSKTNIGLFSLLCNKKKKQNNTRVVSQCGLHLSIDPSTVSIHQPAPAYAFSPPCFVHYSGVYSAAQMQLFKYRREGSLFFFFLKLQKH